MLQHDDFPYPVPSDQLNQGRRPPKEHAVQVIVTRCCTDFHSASSQLRRGALKRYWHKADILRCLRNLPAFEAERTSAGAGFAGLGRRWPEADIAGQICCNAQLL